MQVGPPGVGQSPRPCQTARAHSASSRQLTTAGAVGAPHYQGWVRRRALLSGLSLRPDLSSESVTRSTVTVVLSLGLWPSSLTRSGHLARPMSELEEKGILSERGEPRRVAVDCSSCFRFPHERWTE
jgi:hypothetical protein